MVKNKNLHNAKKAKKDDFYTQLGDIENELTHYEKHFKGKVVYCNCDDPKVSNFYHYFSHNFSRLGIKRLITTCYRSQEPDLFSTHKSENGIWLELLGDRRRSDGSLEPLKPKIGKLKGDGDFRNLECIELLKQADIVITNPPFSLFREYVAQLIKFEKQFLIVAHQNAITYKEIFPFIRDKKIWLGYGFKGGAAHFITPSYEDYAVASDHREGMVRVSGVTWFTNLDHAKRHEDLILYKRYTPEEYPHYDNYDAINVDKTANIPMDWEGAMGVPISFLDKYNPDQFELLGMDYEVKEGLLPYLVRNNWSGKIDRGYIDNKRLYARLFIRNKRPLLQ